MGEMICVCREIDKNTGEIAVYPIKAEVTDRLLFCLGLRQRANPELKYFVTLAENYDANEKPVEREAISIAYSGKTLKPLQTRRGLVFIENRYLSPVSDILDVLELYERITPRGTPYIVAKAGFLLQAVIMPYDVISQQFVDNLKRLTEQCVLSLDLREREKALAHAAEPEQYSLNVDPATGEIVEGENEVADNE